jgi:DNA polymerase-3 subunit delta
MVAKKAGEVDAFLRRPDAGYAVVLVYGPNAGLVSERARHVARGFIDDPDDPFQLIRMDGDDIAADPFRLAEEAHTIGLFGGRRSIWIRAGSRNLLPALEPILKTPPADAQVVIEAADLAKGNPVRLAAEASRNAIALPCYADETRDIVALAETVLKDAGLTIDRDGRERLGDLLGADRQLTRRELEKLSLFAQGTRTVTAETIDAIMADAAAAILDTVIDAAFSGEPAALQTGIARIFAEGDDPGMVVGAALRHAMTLHRHRLAADKGTSLEDLSRRMHFKRKGAFQKQMRLWSTTSLEGAIVTLRETQAQVRKMASIGETLACRAFLTIATRAARGS